jgi:N-methylhydantoinase A
MIIGLDVGGTHTDVVLLGQKGLVRQVKVTTNPSDLFATVLSGLEKITEGIDPENIRRAVLSTTLATNRIVQGRIPDVGMIVSAGPGIDPELFRTGPHYHQVAGAIDHRGREVSPIDEDQVRKVAQRLKENGIRYVGVVSKFSVRNANHETAIGALLGDRLREGVPGPSDRGKPQLSAAYCHHLSQCVRLSHPQGVFRSRRQLVE